MSARRQNPLNVPGDFYVEDECCTRCDVPIRHAPELFGATNHDSCYVKCQPATPEQLDQMLDVIQCAELACIRYRGSNRLIQLRIAELGESHVCDSIPDDLRAISEQTQEVQRGKMRSRERRLLLGNSRRWSRRPYKRAHLIWIIIVAVCAFLLGLVIGNK